MIAQLFQDFIEFSPEAFTSTVGPYLILFCSMIMLWAFERILAKTDINELTAKTTTKRSFLSSNKKKNSTYLQQGFHITGLSSNHLEELRVLINKNDTLELAVFFARYQPSIKEIDEAIESIQSQLSEMWDQLVSTEVKSDKLAGYLRSKNHKSKNLNCLNESDFRSLIEHEQKTDKIIDKNFINRFGDYLFMENFIMYEHLSQSGAAVFHIPPGNDLRHMFDIFVASGVASNGLSITLQERLKILNLNELQSFAAELNIELSIDSFKEITVALLKHEDTEYQFEIKYHRTDIFRLNKEEWNSKAIEEEWDTYNVYAKLLSIQH